MDSKMLAAKLKKIANYDPSDIGLDNGNIFGLPFTTEESAAVILPVPWEVTVSYRAGTAQGPESMLNASTQVDLYDADIQDAWKLGVSMLPISKKWMLVDQNLRKKAVKCIENLENGGKPEDAKVKKLYAEINRGCADLNLWVKSQAEQWLDQGKCVGVMGGEHSVALGLMQALAERHPKYSILHIDAHADLREAYEGFEFSHASIQYNAQKMKQIEKLTVVGIRDYSQQEAERIANSKGRITAFPDREIKHRGYEGVLWKKMTKEIINSLGKKVYVSFDIDALDPALCPHTGTPVPGGLEFEQVFYLLKMLVKSGRTIIGFDLCEVAPGVTDDWDSIVGVRALYRLANLMVLSQKNKLGNFKNILVIAVCFWYKNDHGHSFIFLELKKKSKKPPGKNFKKVWRLGQKEFNTEYFSINKDGELVIHEGNYQYNVHDLARKFGSSVEIFMPFIIEERLSNVYKVANYNIKRLGYKGKFTYHFPMKVNQNKEAMLPLLSEGAHLETSSANQLWLVKKMWLNESFHSKIRVVCNGVKTQQYIDLIKELRGKGLAIIPIIESLEEHKLLKGFGGDVGVRLNLKTRVKSHWDKKIDQFGMDLEEVVDVGKIRGLKVLHYHLGTQIEVENDIIRGLREGFLAYKKLREINPSLDTLNIGGGFAIPHENKKMYSIESVLYRVFKNLKMWADKEGIPHPNIIVEWGTYVTGPAQLSVYKVVASKAIPKAVARQWYLIDGSFINDLLDTWSIHQKWHVVPANHMNEKRRQRVWLAGISCDSDDKYTGNDYLLLPRLEDLSEDDNLYIAILDTGAYQDSFAAHHCMLSSPTKVVLQNGIVTVARKRETPEDVGKSFGW